MTKILKYLFILGILALFTGCASSQNEVKSIFQTNSATLITKDQERLQSLLYKFKSKLDKRNPKNFNKENSRKIYSLIKNSDANFYLKYQDNVLENYKEYLQMAFSKDNILNRNDYLVLGIYYMIADAYNFDDNYKISAMEFSKEKLEKLFKNLQIIKWRIKVEKDAKDNFLFLTWQNNWQIELVKRIKEGKELKYSDLKELEYIKKNKETLFSHSNFSFEVILTQMIDSVGNSLRALGKEPKELAIKAVFLFF